MKSQIDFILNNAIFTREGSFYKCIFGNDEGRGETKREAALETLAARQLRDISQLRFEIERRDDEIEALNLIFYKHGVKISDMINLSNN